ncbi:group II intron reverse transcriptase/maturase [Rhodobacter veldkampii DSM 11550]|uniref:Group II intron reverse transcriptase/maturase n=1 Tax=Phaeovulum veldkampii DSM 11550 TaxID=1185920 RepID=A0A2T4J7K6_9RHOB|nr:group II intron reverse transcriptase/maturase [Phaeovulum veldkampii]MBK5945777.1 group II intron reverse transcriptase/maturase [Phaeovulum veldkampii DSM 11550]PTE13875.1 group II intron reverse transcriptase/maturase [Phaeovulum veldkampii DSM 11550]TDQ56955.1 group II intron reverse transcriptase/maturase [Phaeovulum veldkampii DSM 11550]
MSGTVNTGFVLDMQRKLHRWSAADPDRRFADLFNLVCDRRTLIEAWIRLSRNKGSNTPGTDGVTRKAVERRLSGAVGYLEDIRADLRQGTYEPQPVRQRLIPKPGKPGKFRPLGIPTLRDRLVQMALKLVLEPIFEADFYPTSYGFRPGRSTHDALARVRHKLNPTSAGPSRVRYVIEGDIKGCFDAIDHHVLMERVRRRIRDRKVLRLVLAFLKADIMIEGTLRHPVTGTPQGGIISPLLANVYLTGLDERYRRWVPNPRDKTRERAQQRLQSDHRRGRPGFYVVRYADDFVLLVQGTRKDAEIERQALAQFLQEELRMELSMEKTKITDVREGFDFLGYRVAQKKMPSTGRHVGMIFIPKAKSQLLRDRVKANVRGTPTGTTLAALIGDLNPVIIGWRNYYRYATRSWAEFSKLDWWLYWRIKSWLGQKHGTASGRKLRRKYTEKGPRAHGGWASGGKTLARFSDAKRVRYRDRGLRIPNGWDDPDESFRQGADTFWEATRTLAKL